MKNIEKKLVYEHLQNCFQQAFNEVQAICMKEKTGLTALKTINNPTEYIPYFQYILEVVVDKNIQLDDYGVSFTLNISNVFADIGLQMDIVRPSGEVLFFEEYLLKMEADCGYSQSNLNEISEKILTTSQLLFAFVRNN